MLSLEGRQLGNYDVMRRIRAGGMGAVYEGRQRTAFGRRVAIKVILGDYAKDPDMRRRFAREAKTIARLHHPHILQLIEFGDEQGLLYLVMPFIEGGTLTSYLRRYLPDLQEISTIFLQLLEAVEYAHEEGLIHRDIKSSNVLLEGRRNGRPYTYLADFGLVRTIQQAELESNYAGTPIPLEQVPGTPQYMAPEQTRGIVTPATDIYALGVLLYQMLTGELPYTSDDDVAVIKMQMYAPIPNPCDMDASIPAELGAVVVRAMAKRPDQRFVDVTEFREVFLSAIEKPVRHFDNSSVISEDGQDFQVYEVSPRPSVPLKPLRLSQQLRPLEPGAIAFREAHLQAARQPRTTAENKGQDVAPEKPVAQPQPPVPAAKATFAAQGTVTAQPTKTRRRFGLAAMVGISVPALLILLLLLPRAMGLSFFPPGFPLLGPPSIATITLVTRSQAEQGNFLLTASPQVTQTNVEKRIIPDISVQGKASENRTVATSGLQTTPGVQASGFLFFDNSSSTPISISSGFTFTSSGGVQIELVQSVVVPPRSAGINGTISASAVAVTPGIAGNIPFNALHELCCGGLNQVVINNPAAFHGGSDAIVTHQVTQEDLSSVKRELTDELEQQAQQKISQQIQSNEEQGSPLTYAVGVTSNSPVGSQATQVTVTVTVTATAIVYNVQAARDLAQQLFNSEATQSLGPNYQPRGTSTIAPPQVEQHSANGTLYLSVSTSGVWAYTLTAQQEEQWRQAIKGASTTLAQNYLSTRTGILAAHIQLPFATQNLPTDETKIVFVVQQ
jgi:serine/threonine protein kinase